MNGMAAELLRALVNRGVASPSAKWCILYVLILKLRMDRRLSVHVCILCVIRHRFLYAAFTSRVSYFLSSPRKMGWRTY